MNANSTHDSGGAKSPANAVTAPDMTAPTVRPVVGGVYGDRTGREHGPMTLDRLWNGGFRAPSGLTWKASGHFYDTPTVHVFDLITVVSEPGSDAQDEAKGISAKVMQIEICAPETEATCADTYLITQYDGYIGVKSDGGDFLSACNASARVIANAILRMTEGGE